jgi:uncharacterized protein
MSRPPAAQTIHTPDDLVVNGLARTLAAQLIETHISWVLLSGETVYKLKKPLRLAFVDYSTLAARKHFCEEEMRLNRRLAPSLYLGVARITGCALAPEVDGTGPVLDYAVRMRRFPAGALFSELLRAGAVLPADVDGLATLAARFHQQAPHAGPGSEFGQPAARRAVALAALEGATPAMSPNQAAMLKAWLHNEANALSPLWSQRHAAGLIRECHGDMHLSNVVRLEGAAVAFDGIEFDPALRWIDVIDDIAFPVMDFAAAGRRDFAFRLLNGWLDLTGDHTGVTALRFSIVYRALVRAQVELLRSAQAPAKHYVDAALAWLPTTGRPALFITHGLPGSGKTFRSQQLLEREGAIHLRSDVERKRLFGLGTLDDSRAAGLNLYDAPTTARTYEQLFDIARSVLRSGYPVVIDAAFLRRAERAQAHALAQELSVPFSIVVCQAPLEVLRARLDARRDDASEANAAVLEQLKNVAEPLAGEERRWIGDSCRCSTNPGRKGA